MLMFPDQELLPIRMKPTDEQPTTLGEHNKDRSLNTSWNCTYHHAWPHMDILDWIYDEKYLSATIEELFGNIVTNNEPQGQKKEPLSHTQEGTHQQPPPHLNPGVNDNFKDCNYTAPPKPAPPPKEPVQKNPPFKKS